MSSHQTKCIQVTELDHVAYVKLDRPQVRNAFDPQMISEITLSFQNFSQRKDLRAVVLQGEGKVFCAGADLEWMKSMVDFDINQNQADSEKLFLMFETIYNCELPVIGVVHGAAYGGALGLLACCDYVIAEEKTAFCFSEVKIGLVPAVISAFFQRKFSPASFRFLMLSGQVFNFEEASSMGLVHEVHQIQTESEVAHELNKKLQHYLTYFKESGPQAVKETKKLLNQLSQSKLEAQMGLTTKVIAERRVSAEGQEGLKSFIEKKSPSWKL